MQKLLIRPSPLFADRSEAGRALAAELEGESGPEPRGATTPA